MGSVSDDELLHAREVGLIFELSYVIFRHNEYHSVFLTGLVIQHTAYCESRYFRSLKTSVLIRPYTTVTILSVVLTVLHTLR